MQLYQQSVHIVSDKDLPQSAVNHEDFSIYLLAWEFTGLKSSYSH